MFQAFLIPEKTQDGAEGLRGLIKDQRTFLELAKLDRHSSTSPTSVDLSVLPAPWFSRPAAITSCREGHEALGGARVPLVLGTFLLSAAAPATLLCWPAGPQTHADTLDGHYLAYSSQFLALRSPFFT